MTILEMIASCDNAVLFKAVQTDIDSYVDGIQNLVELGVYDYDHAIDLCDQVEGAYRYQMRKFGQIWN